MNTALTMMLLVTGLPGSMLNYSERTLSRFSFSEVHMGVRVTVTGYAAVEAEGEEAAKAAFRRFAEIDAALSDYRRDSELNRLVAQPPHTAVPVSADLFRVLRFSREVSESTEGAFDVTVGPLSALWREMRKSGRLPLESLLADARSRVDYRAVITDPSDQTVQLRRERVKLDLGGIAKGYACSQAIEALRGAGVDRALVEAGGDMAASGPPPGKLGWRIAIRGVAGDPIWLRDRALSTSGDSEQFVVVSGKRYSHILDPRTGLGVTVSRQATVIARDGLVTDPLATALCILGPDAEARLRNRFGIERVIWAN
jgi:thiamine biosynthesis lipoprotein